MKCEPVAVNQAGQEFVVKVRGDRPRFVDLRLTLLVPKSPDAR